MNENKPYRIDFLLGQIKKDIPADEAYAALELYEERLEIKRKNLRGEETEFFVARILSDLPNVEYVIRSDPFSELDMQGIDLSVGLLGESIESVGVQVKSSFGYVWEFKANKKWEGNIIVINGRRGRSEVIEAFNEGLEMMGAYRQEPHQLREAY